MKRSRSSSPGREKSVDRLARERKGSEDEGRPGAPENSPPRSPLQAVKRAHERTDSSRGRESNAVPQPTAGAVGGLSSGSRPMTGREVRPQFPKYERDFDWDAGEYQEEDGGRADEAVFEHAQMGNVLRGNRSEALRAFSRMADGNDLTDLLYRWNRYMANGEGMTRGRFNQQIEITAWDIKNERRRIAQSAPRDIRQVQYTKAQRGPDGVWTIEAQTASHGSVGRVRWQLSRDGSMEITELQTDVDWEGKGIGRALMLMAEKQGVAAGARIIRLEPNAQRPGRFRTLGEAQVALVGFYASLGYRAEGRSGWMSKRVAGI